MPREKMSNYPSRMAMALVAMLAIVTLSTAASGEERWGDWRTIGVDEGLPSNKVFAVLADGDVVWAGTDHGLARVEGGRTRRIFTTEDGLPHPVVTALAIGPRTGDLWIGTMGGLARLSGGRIDAFTQFTSGLANDVVYGVAVDGAKVWIATAAGLSAFDPRNGAWELYDVTNTLMHEPWCYAVTTNETSVVVAVWGGGVVEYDRKSKRFREHRDPDGEMEIDLFRDDGLVHDVTSSVSSAEGVLWVGTYFGLSRYENRRWRTYSESDSGLAGDFINAVRADGSAVWIATDQGLNRFDGEHWITWRRGASGHHERVLTGPDGVAQVERVQGGPATNVVFAVDVDGRRGVWLATSGGLSHGRSMDAETMTESREQMRAVAGGSDE